MLQSKQTDRHQAYNAKTLQGMLRCSCVLCMRSLITYSGCYDA